MGRTFTLTVRCDEGTSPDCLREVAETRDSTRHFDHIAMELFQQGWLMGWRRTDPDDPEAFAVHDICPACAAPEVRAQSLLSKR